MTNFQFSISNSEITQRVTPGRMTLPPPQPQGLTRSEFRLQAVRAALFQEAA